jgi:hypothetical protein
MPKINDPEAADLTTYLVDHLDGDETAINGRRYAVLACHLAEDYQTVFLELVDLQDDGPDESIVYNIKITKKRKR